MVLTTLLASSLASSPGRELEFASVDAPVRESRAGGVLNPLLSPCEDLIMLLRCVRTDGAEPVVWLLVIRSPVSSARSPSRHRRRSSPASASGLPGPVFSSLVH